MFGMAYMKPESRKAGRKVATMAIWLATSWDFATIDISIPRLSPPKRNRDESPASRNRLPFIGTSNKKTARSTDTSISIKPIRKYGMSFPRMNSGVFTGVDMSCSMVPLSHSRATVREVRSAAITDMITAIRPGMM